MNNPGPGGPSHRHFVSLSFVAVALAILVVTAGSAQAASLTSSPSSVSFGTVAVGNKNTQTLAIKNSTASGVTVSSVSVSGSGFSISALTTPFSLNAGATTYFAVGFKPTASGSFEGSITLKNSSGSALVTIGLSGTGSGAQAASLTSTPSSVSFGTVAVGNKNTQTLAIKNSTASGVTVSSVSVSGSGFSISALTTPFSLNAGATTYFAVGFKPTASGSFAGSVTLKNSSGSALVTIGLSGTGSGSTKSLVSSTSSLNFGNETVGESTTLAVPLINTGNSSVTISGVSVNGSSYSVTSGISGATLAAGQTATMHIVFAPKTTGTLNGTVTVVSNATNTAPSVSVSGTGISNTSHSVALNWTASSSSGVAGYNVYRSTISGTSYSRLNSSPTASLKYTDGSVSSGGTYYYVVTAVSTAGMESVRSSQIKAVIP